MKEIKNPVSGSLRLGITPGPAELLLPILFAEFRRMYPSMALHTYEGGTATVIELVKTHSIDLALFGAPDLTSLNLTNLTIEQMCTTEFVAVASQHHRLAHKEHISKMQLENETILAFSEEFLLGDLLDATLGTRFETNIIYTTNNPLSAFPLAQTSTGIIFLPRFVMEAPQMETKLRGLRMLDLAPEIHLPVYYACAYHGQRSAPEPIRALIEIMKGSFHSITAGKKIQATTTFPSA